MSLGADEIRRIAALANLELADEDLPDLVRQVAAIVEYVGDLGTATEAAPAKSEPSALRADAVDPIPLAGPIGDFAPEFRDGFFLVPRPAGLDTP